jgi:hypothetical protein
MGVQIAVRETVDCAMIRLVGNKLVKEQRVENLYIVPPKGEYQFQITGYAEPFEMPRAVEYGGGMQTMTRVELTITEGKGKGRMFDQLWGCTIGPKSNLGKFLRAMKVPVAANENGEFDLDNIIGYIGSGYVTASDAVDNQGKPRYARLAIDTVEGISPPKRTYSYDLEAEEEDEGDFGEVVGVDPISYANGNSTTATDDGWPTG